MSDGRIFTDWSDLNSTAQLDELPFRRKVRHVLLGLTAPTCAGHRKWALFQIKRSYSLIYAIVVPFAVALLIGFVISQHIPVMENYHEVTYREEAREPEKVLDDVEPVEPIKTEDESEPGQQLIDNIIREIASENSYEDDPSTESAPNDMPSITDLTVVANISPFKMKAFVDGSGLKRQRKEGLEKYGPPGSRDSVLLALRWLKKTQNADGTWGRTKPAMTSLALLAYLAHAETPASEEFGYTVEKAIVWLLDNQKPDGRFNNSDVHEYSLPIAAYALSEAFSMTQIPDVRYAAEKAVDLVIKGQQPGGGWDYNCKVTQRNDTSFSGWCIQALKAAKLASLDVDGLDQAIARAADGLRQNYRGNSEYGGFGYTSGAQGHGLTSVGVLGLQLMGYAESAEVEAGLRTLSMDKFKFDLMSPKCGKNGLYYWYYATQAMFHKGGDIWKAWDKSFSTDLVSNQKVIPEDQSDYVDHKGQPRAIGFWDQYEGSGKDEGPVFATLLCVLQLEVYYRYLPSFQAPDQNIPDAAPLQRRDDVNIQIVI
jgi:hypothetical protein